MKKQLLQNLYMLDATVQFAESTAQETQILAPFGETVNTISGLIDEYLGLSNVMVSNITGYADMKHTRRKALEDVVIEITRLSKQFAKKTGNEVLRKKVMYTPSAVKRMRNEQICLVASNTSAVLTPYVGEMDTYLITQASLDEMIAAKDAFRAVMSVTVNEKGAKHASLVAATNAIKSAVEITRGELDELAMALKKYNESWYVQYLVNRKVIDIGSHPTQIKGLVVNSSLAGIYGASVVARKGDDVFSCDTDINGNFSLKNLKPGVYSATIHKPGFKPFETGYFQVKLGQSSIVNTMLQSELSQLKIAS